MKEITINAKAKINLSLEIFEKRRDGYHDMRSIMHKIELCDKVKVEVCENDNKKDANAGEIRVFCSKPVCDEKDNLAYKAADSFANIYYNKTGKIFFYHNNYRKEHSGQGRSWRREKSPFRWRGQRPPSHRERSP